MASEDAVITTQPPSETRDPSPSAPSVPRWVGWMSGLGPPGFAAVYREGRRRGIEDTSAAKHPGVTRFWKKILGLWAVLFVLVLLFGLTYGAATDYFDHGDTANVSPANSEASRLADDAALEAGVFGLATLSLLPVAAFAVARAGALTFHHGFHIGQRTAARPAGWSALDWWRKLRARLTRRSASAIVLWRVQVTVDGILAIFLIETIGRWPAAWIMGLVFAACSAVYLFLLDGERVMHDLSGWIRERRFVRRFILPIAERPDRTGTFLRILAIPYTIMLMAPFARAITFHSLKVPRIPAYTISVLGSIPHQLFWIGIVLGSLWEIALKPAFLWLWDEALEPFFDWIWVESLQPALAAPYDAAAALVGVLV
ncbi:MAG: hypothetical protein IH957_01995 [Chloroflexi bacterium]|nr:hypothetical protein [Chloroflexota bacterium]